MEIIVIRQRHVPEAMLYGVGQLPVVAPQLAHAAARLATLRRLVTLHVNRTLAVEAVFRDLGLGVVATAEGRS